MKSYEVVVGRIVTLRLISADCRDELPEPGTMLAVEGLPEKQADNVERFPARAINSGKLYFVRPRFVEYS